ncbi:hypothetical protein [Eleftheria terrae]|uniref:hypothetical protein n=1 Tax=Eleftheria terrae TaxID=1597781 RepID=UPI00263A5F30|nr:hypothetical protein [Eleftheria terrae]WKB51929.1 hypothetical protein N7L95_19300 [Eleftheria terrae]
MKLMKLAVAAAALAALAACGGGGGSAGSNPFGENNKGDNDAIPVSNAQPSQRNFTIAAEDVDLNWYNKQEETTLNITIGDTAGLPAGVGSTVQFAVEYGYLANSTCKVVLAGDATSKFARCGVGILTGMPLPTTLPTGVTVMAWMEGEEAYVDTNGNGKYDANEPFWDSGQPFMDVDNNHIYEEGVDRIVVGTTSGSKLPGVGTVACAAGPATEERFSIPDSMPNTCDGKWGKTLIRAVMTLEAKAPEEAASGN